MFRRIIGLFAILLLGSASALRAQTPSPIPIRLISSASDDLRPILYGQQSGLFARAGLNVTIENSTSGAVAAQSIIAGAMDIGKSSLASLIAGYTRGLPFVLIAPSAIHRPSDPNSAVIVAATSALKSPLELQGKVVACTAIGDIGYLGLRGWIDGHGGDSSTVKWVELPTSSVAAALEAGRIDAGISTEPYMTKDLKGGKVRFLVDVLAGYPHPILESAFYATRDYVAKNRDTVNGFAKALAQAAAYSNTHPAETAQMYAAFAKIDPTALAGMHLTFTPTTFDAQQVQPVVDLAAKYGIIPKVFDAREMIAAGPR